MQTIQCIKCGEIKELGGFPNHPNGKFKKGRKCFLCVREYRQEYYLKNKKRILATNKFWRDTHRQSPSSKDLSKIKIKKKDERSVDNKWDLKVWNRNYALKKNFNLTTNEYLEIFAIQGGECAICERVREESERWFAVDHDHDTGEVRGILCHKCNTAIGLLGDSPIILQKAIQYLKNG